MKYQMLRNEHNVMVEAGKYKDLCREMKRVAGSCIRCEMCISDDDDIESNIQNDDETCGGRMDKKGELYRFELRIRGSSRI